MGLSIFPAYVVGTADPAPCNYVVYVSLCAVGNERAEGNGWGRYEWWRGTMRIGRNDVNRIGWRFGVMGWDGYVLIGRSEGKGGGGKVFAR